MPLFLSFSAMRGSKKFQVRKVQIEGSLKQNLKFPHWEKKKNDT